VGCCVRDVVPGGEVIEESATTDSYLLIADDTLHGSGNLKSYICTSCS
jgi:hypothetical protein